MLRQESNPFDQAEINDTEQFKRVSQYLDNINTENVLINPDAKFDDFKNLLIQLNGVIRNLEPKERKMDGVDVALKDKDVLAYVPPDFNDKEKLLEKMFDEGKIIVNKKDKALLFSTIINAIHPFSDANGRVNRVVNVLINKESPEAHNLKEILSDYGREYIDMRPSLMEKDLLKVLKEQFLDFKPKDKTKPDRIKLSLPKLKKTTESIKNELLKQGVDKQSIDKFIVILRDINFRDIPISKYLIKQNKLTEYTKTITQTDETPIATLIDIENLITNLDQEDINDIIRCNKEAKKRYIEIMIDSLVNPENYPTSNGKTIKESYTEWIDNLAEVRGTKK